MGYIRYEPVNTIIDGETIEMINSYGCYTSKYVRLSGKPYYKGIENRPKNLYSKTQCKNMKRQVGEKEEPVAFSKAMHGYYPLFLRV
ncbi:hypothetical protein BHU72_14580 [Desulfuribacillus stibiiarsenatis]|uniref:Uncharacterized protein n=1 Tax=Desulfuribacillus stibiiarsenatis TaxID=1390249 RepID=A0A1E5L7Y7_9FIRM|nr:hypothetical protein [Desulfuribacillus stibiiarsenatis]OEH86053.1 hypothetical protein BHU72_14580 [Desulfuribacillus stibiiarsenatis]